jgi:hypothetical protein
MMPGIEAVGNEKSSGAFPRPRAWTGQPCQDRPLVNYIRSGQEATKPVFHKTYVFTHPEIVECAKLSLSTWFRSFSRSACSGFGVYAGPNCQDLPPRARTAEGIV